MIELATIVKVKSLPATLRAMPIGVEQIIPSGEFKAQQVRKAVFDLKKKGYQFQVTSPIKMADTYITRIK